MQLDEFNRTSSLVGALNGGVTSIERALLNIGSLAKNQAANSVQKVMASRIDKALAKLSSSPATALSDHLKTNQSLLISRKNGINESIEVVSKSLAQINDSVIFFKNSSVALNTNYKIISYIAVFSHFSY